ncbi:MAG: CHAD domain-containing protein [Hyphomicrobiales bacterium]
MTAAQDHTEVEWQFAALDVRPVLRWLEGARVPGYEIAASGTKELHDTYFDTPDWRVYRARFTARVRRKPAGAELTLKSMAEAKDGVRSRREITDTLPEAENPNPLDATGPGGDALRLLAGRQPLRPLFTLDQVRRAFVLRDGEGELAEVAVDDTAIPVGLEDVPVRLARVEVELTDGTLERAQRFVDVLVAACGLQPATTSKFEAALVATGLRPMAGPPLGPTAVAPAMTTGEVAFAVLRKHFAAFLANEAGSRLGEDIEALHDMRVGARRLRAAMQTFRPYLPARIERYRFELGWVAGALGDVRDLDVQLERLEEWRAAGDDPQALDAIERLLRERRERARRRMLAVLNSRRYERLVERFAAVLQRGAPRSFAAGREPILVAAPGLLQRRYRRVRKRGDAIGRSAPADAYHQLRIDCKKLRYALEFVGPVYGKPALEFSARVTALQDLLGLHQDAYVAVDALWALARDNAKHLRPETLLAMGAISERYRQHAARLRREFPAVYGPLRGREWQRLRRLLDGERERALARAGS